MAATGTRPPAVAGLFYPEDPEELVSDVEGLLEAVEAPTRPSGARAVIAPHAGYVYSGPIAASAFRALEGSGSTKVILVGPSHFVRFRGLALPTAASFALPGGSIEVDPDLAARAAALAPVRLLDEAHEREHALEVELPFLRAILGSFSILPLVVGEATPEEVRDVLEALWDPDESLLVVSSDLSHYLSYGEARRADTETAAQVLRLESPLEPWRACGATAIDALTLIAGSRGLAPRLHDLRNSGDTAGGTDRVVGYGAFSYGAA